MTHAILAMLGVFTLQAMLPASLRYLWPIEGVGARLRVALGPRDEQPPLSPIASRAARALANAQESMPVFLGLALLHAQRAAPVELAVAAAWVFVGARTLYVPAYLSGVPGVRSGVWSVGACALVVMALALS